MTFRIRQRTRQQKSLFFDSDLIYLAMMLCMGLFLSVCLADTSTGQHIELENGRACSKEYFGPLESSQGGAL